MGEWKKIKGHFRESQNYSCITESPAGDTWCAMQKTDSEIRLVAGFGNNYEVPVVTISCRRDQKMFRKIEPLIQKVISWSPKSAPFSLIPIGDKVNGVPSDAGVMYGRLTLLARGLEKKQAPPIIAVVSVEQKEKRIKQKPQNGKYVNANMSTFNFKKADLIKVDEPHYTSEEVPETSEGPIQTLTNEVLQDSAEFDELAEQETDETSEPVRERKIEMTHDEYIDYMSSLNFEIPSLGKTNVDYDIRLIVFNPGREEKSGRTNNLHSPESMYQYKVSFGRFFTERNLNFKDVLVGAKELGDKDKSIEIALLFDNELLRKEKTNNIITLPTTTSKGEKVMAIDSTRKDFGATLVLMGQLNINKAVNTNTIFKWNVWPIGVKDVPAEANKNFKLLDVIRETFKANALTAIDPSKKTIIENNPNE